MDAIRAQDRALRIQKVKLSALTESIGAFVKEQTTATDHNAGDSEMEHWLRNAVLPAHAAMVADPSRGTSLRESRAMLSKWRRILLSDGSG